jgi:gluconate 2-dehydrogenase gamma chain
MDERNKFSRRDFIKITTLGTVAISLPASGLSFFEGCSTSQQFTANFFTEKEIKLVEAIAEQIIPTDNWPGGKEAGVANFLDLQLAGPYNRFQPDYRKGLNALQNYCTNKFDNKFENLSFDKQTGILQKMETGNLGRDVWSNGFDKYFFELLRSQCMQGYYGSPRHGGNKNFISYKMIGIDEPAIVGENRDGI